LLLYLAGSVAARSMERYSTLSFLFAAFLIFHYMLLGASAPLRFNGKK